MSIHTLLSQKTSFQLEDFIIKDQIGVGKFGAVYKAIQKQSQQIVAIKIIPKRSIASEILYTQLKRQIEIQSRLKHPSICELYAYFHDVNNVFIVLEYCSQGSLAYTIKEKKEVLPEKKIAAILLQIVEGIAYMHARHVMHRDLKLQNILLDEQRNIKISDFGWCVHHPSRRNTFCGTMEYISPEMLNKESYQHSIDMYCVGIILYELFYFRSPFLGQDQAQTIENIKEGKLYFDDDVRLVPQEAKNLIGRLLDRDPLKRPKAKDLFNDQFISKLSRNSEKKKAKRRITQETFNQFKEEIFKLSQLQAPNAAQPTQNAQITENKEQEELAHMEIPGITYQVPQQYENEQNNLQTSNISNQVVLRPDSQVYQLQKNEKNDQQYVHEQTKLEKESEVELTETLRHEMKPISSQSKQAINYDTNTGQQLADKPEQSKERRTTQCDNAQNQ